MLQSEEKESPLTSRLEAAAAADSDKENMPPSVLKKFGGPAHTSVFNRGNKMVTLEENPVLFRGLVFFLEIFQNGQVADSFFTKAVISHGGKVSRRLGKHVTHLVWSQGRPKTLKKAQEYEGIKIISTLWFQETLREMKLADESHHKPSALEEILAKETQQELQSASRGLTRSVNQINKKRVTADPSQIKLYERPSELSKQTASKTKQPASQATVEEHSEDDEEEKVDEFDVEAAIKKMKDERTFQKEFAKDMRKLAKIKTKLSPSAEENEEEEKVAFASMLSKKRTGAGELIDKFIDGNLSIDDYVTQKHLKTSKNTRGGHKRGGTQRLNKTVNADAAMRRLSEFFGGPLAQEAGSKEEPPQIEEVVKPTAGVKMCLNDILAELDESPPELLPEKEEEKDANRAINTSAVATKQTNLKAFIEGTANNEQFSKARKTEIRQTSRRPRLDESSTLQQIKENTILRAKRSESAMKVMQHQQSDSEESKIDFFASSSEEALEKPAVRKEKRRAAAKSQSRKAAAKDTKIKRNPMRGCKLGVSYAEIESNDNDQSSRFEFT